MPANASVVAFQGEPGAYGETAALNYFRNPKLIPLKSFREVFAAAERGDASSAIVPVENSIEGSVNEVYDLLLETKKLEVTGEVYQRVRHCLVANPGATKKKIKSVHSHPQALAQCRIYLQKNKMEPVPAYDTAGAAKMIMENGSTDSAAIASKRAAELYGMQVLDEGIEDRKNNYTRFLILSLRGKIAKPRRSTKYKTSLIFSVKHVPGALFGIVGEFAIRKINLTRIESRPTKETPWEYNFYVDFEGHVSEKRISQALKAIRRKTLYLKILGSYRKAELTSSF
jgi:prephenate dehydratase